jgi:hypothetical protein
MRQREKGSETAPTATIEDLPEFKPWRQIGWIFRDGSCIAIERQGDETRARVLGD